MMMAAWWKRQRSEPPAPYFSDDILIEIFVRLPAMPLGRCKCVSRSWRDLISGPVHHRRLARTDATSGFFYHAHGSRAPGTTNLNFAALCPPDESESGGSPASPAPSIDQAFPFLPCPSTTGTQQEMKLLDSCNGLLLLSCRRHANNFNLAVPRYIVCDPTIDGWEVELPVPSPEPCRARFFDPLERRWECPELLQLELDSRILRPAALAFDPAVSSHFHVFELVEEDSDSRHSRHSSRYAGGRAVKAVRIYSSVTGEWARRDSAWSYRVAYAGDNAHLFSGGSEWTYRLAYAGNHAYHDGALHLATTDVENGSVVVASVDTLGKTWRATRVCPADSPAAALGGVVGQSQHCLLYVDAGSGHDRDELSVYALENGVDDERRGS